MSCDSGVASVKCDPMWAVWSCVESIYYLKFSWCRHGCHNSSKASLRTVAKNNFSLWGPSARLTVQPSIRAARLERPDCRIGTLLISCRLCVSSIVSVVSVFSLKCVGNSMSSPIYSYACHRHYNLFTTLFFMYFTSLSTYIIRSTAFQARTDWVVSTSERYHVSRWLVIRDQLNLN